MTHRMLAYPIMTALLGACAGVVAEPRVVPAPPQVEDPYFQAAAARVQRFPATRRARNAIVFIGDGMGVSSVTAARIYAGQRQGLDGESYELAMDTFPHVALSRTYGHDSQIPDSAPTATAILSGIKTGQGIVGLSSGATPGICAGSEHFIARSLLELAEDAGLSTGVVTTVTVTHATPAAAYAHAANRGWENDVALASAGGAGCVDIARQLVEWPAGDGLEVVLGGGRANFMRNTQADPQYPGSTGERADGRDLTEAWRALGPDRVYVWNSAQLAAADPDARILGLFARYHMAYESARDRDAAGQPSLAEMTAAAIRRLSRDGDGYVLLVEGGLIDYAHHDGRAAEALSETIAFDDAIRTALQMTSREDTLIVVTADHSHTLTISGYAARGNPILGLSADAQGRPALALDGKPYTTLGYANGLGSVLAPEQGGAPPAPVRPDLRGIDTQTMAFRQQALTPLADETHSGEDVALYAWGPGDDAAAGTLEQNSAFHIMARALGLRWR